MYVRRLAVIAEEGKMPRIFCKIQISYALIFAKQNPIIIFLI